MQCKNHPDRTAKHFCTTCNTPICTDCGEEIRPGEYTCFQCGMLQSISQVGTSLEERRQRTAEKKNRKPWGPFHFFLVVSSVLLCIMWGVIFFGAQPAPQQASLFIEKDRAGRVLLFLVDGAIKRYVHYERKGYPNRLADLVPKYLQIRKEQIGSLSRLVYDLDPQKGYRLSLARTKKGEMKVILTPKGIEYSQSLEGRS